jgi:excinuclease ABC subunit C
MTTPEQLRDHLEGKLNNLPKQPGVYLFKDRSDDIIYIGKAAVLADRVRSYFQKGADLSPKIRALVAHAVDLETIIAKSELEALILESISGCRFTTISLGSRLCGA